MKSDRCALLLLGLCTVVLANAAALSLAEIEKDKKHDPLPALLKSLESDSHIDRRWAAEVLGTLGKDAPQAVRGLQKALGEANDTDRLDIALALAELGAFDPKVKGAIDVELRRSVQGFSGKFQVVSLLSSFHRLGIPAKEFLPTIHELIEKEKPEEIWLLAGFLPLSGEDARVTVPLLVKGLEKSPEDKRYLFVYSLGQMGPAAKASLPRIKELLKENKGRFVKPACLVASYALDPDNQDAVDALRKYLADSSDKERHIALLELSELKEKGSPFVGVLAGLVEASSEPVYVRDLAARALGEIGMPAAKAGISALRKATKADHWRLQQQAIKALLKLDAKLATDAVPSVVTRLGSEDQYERLEAAELLGVIGKTAESTVPDLRKRFRDKDFMVALVAAKAVLKLAPEDKEAIALLVNAMSRERTFEGYEGPVLGIFADSYRILALEAFGDLDINVPEEVRKTATAIILSKNEEKVTRRFAAKVVVKLSRQGSK